MSARTQSNTLVLILLAVAALSAVYLHLATSALMSRIDGLMIQTAALAEVEKENAAARSSLEEVKMLLSDDAAFERLEKDISSLRPQMSVAASNSVGETSRMSAASAPVYSADQVEKLPRSRRAVSPKYPAELFNTGVQGTVLLSFTVGVDGRVRDPKVEETSHPAFAEAALEAIRQWEFEPARKGGAPVGVRMKTPLLFNGKPSAEGVKKKWL